MMKARHTLLILSFLLLFNVNSYSQDFYDINTINTVEITFAESNWDYLLDNLFAAGDEERLLGSIVINGTSYDSVGVRYKGNSSYNANQVKNPLNIKLDYMVDNQEHEDYGTLKLANVYKDPSFVREVLSYEIARQYMPASRANYTKVYINGTYLGLYTSVQDVDKHFVSSHYNSRNNSFFKGELTNDSPQNVVKIWGYFGEDSASYTAYYELESDYGWADLINFLDILNNNPESIEAVLNVDRHLWMLAYDILFVNLDSPVNFAHNYYLYQDDAGRFNPIIWDLNENFGVFSMLLSGSPLSTYTMQRLDPFLNSTNSNFPIINKILSDPTYKKMYVAHMKTIMDDYFSTGLFRSRALEIQDIIATEVQNDPNKFYTYTNFTSNLDYSVGSGGGRPGQIPSVIGITELMDARVAYLSSLAEFQTLSPEISNIEKSPANPGTNTNVWITARATSAESVQLAYRSSLTAAFEKIAMADDGNNNDGSAGDGIYGVSMPTGTSGFQYYIYAENDDAVSFSPARAAYEFYTLAVSGDLVINEFMASNDLTAEDSQGEFDDWIEIYNNTDNDIALSGFYLSDDSDDLTQWAFPDTIISANGYLIVWADNDSGQVGLHANFKLSGSGETIYLVNSDTLIVDEVNFSEQTTDISTGRYPNGTGAFTQMDPTFSAENQSGVTSVASDDVASVPDGFTLNQNYPNPFNPSTTISFELASPSMTSLKIYNLMGQEVVTLIDEQLSAGTHQLLWNAQNLASGIYFYNLRSGSFSETKRMIFMK